MLVRRRPRVRRPHPRRGGALYMVVVCSSLVITLAGLAGMRLMVTDRASLKLGRDVQQAQLLSRSAVELGFVKVNQTPSTWRTVYASGAETTPVRIHPDIPGTVSWLLRDSDGSLAKPDAELKLLGLGRVGEAVQAASVRVKEIDRTNGPSLLRNMTSTSSRSNDNVRNDRWWCQYLKVTLPSDATKWWVTEIDLYMLRGAGSGTTTVTLYKPLASRYPSSTVIDSLSRQNSTLPLLRGWTTFGMSAATRLDPGDGICITVTSPNSNQPAEITYRSGGVSEANSALMEGDPGWKDYKSDKALLYRLNGCYLTSTGKIEVIPGTWQSEAAP